MHKAIQILTLGTLLLLAACSQTGTDSFDASVETAVAETVSARDQRDLSSPSQHQSLERLNTPTVVAADFETLIGSPDDAPVLVATAIPTLAEFGQPALNVRSEVPVRVISQVDCVVLDKISVFEKTLIALVINRCQFPVENVGFVASIWNSALSLEVDRTNPALNHFAAGQQITYVVSSRGWQADDRDSLFDVLSIRISGEKAENFKATRFKIPGLEASFISQSSSTFEYEIQNKSGISIRMATMTATGLDADGFPVAYTWQSPSGISSGENRIESSWMGVQLPNESKTDHAGVVDWIVEILSHDPYP